MPIRTTDRWRAPSRGTPEQAIATFTRWGSFPIGQVSRFVRKTYALCAIGTLDAALLVSHAALESGDEDEGKGFLDENWAVEDKEDSTKNRYQPGGMGVTDWEDLGYGNPDGEAAAYAFFGHHARYEIPTSDPIWTHPEMQKAARADQRWDAVPAANIGTVKTVAAMTGKWWTNKDGHTNLASRGNQIYPNLPDQGASTGGTTTTPDTTTTTGGTTVGFDIGNRPLRIAIGTGHANTSGGNEFELGINRLVTNEVINLLRASKGFEVKCYTPLDGLGYFNGPLDTAAAQVRTWWAQGWQADILHEVHQEGLGQSSVRGGFVIYPDSSGLSGRKASGGDDIDIDVRDAAGEMAKRIVAAYGGTTRYTPARGMSERETGVGGDGYRLGVFGAWSEDYLVNSTCRFITEGATYTNPTDLAMMRQAGFAAKQARGIVDAYVYLAKTRGNWTYPYEIAGTVTTPTTPDKPQVLTPVDPWFLNELAAKGYADDEGTIWYADNADYVVSAANGTRQLRFATAGGGTIGSDLTKGTTVHAIAKGQSKTDKKIYIVATNKARILRDDLKAA